ncbi:ABC transporter permease subunit [Romboutsia maritimum]|uniref:ABC transporter permease subunit n=1 Tax=Romboutsia maritimum TaxID=2020948 RepID=A0A371IRM4_9FIRM|nr:ABC transporter permease [Romboutsia maritimum]RDY23123.1 ABC transporter permease subunit [Romboutsia maritimum]
MKNKKINLFEVISYIITIMVVIFMSLIVLTILVEGIPYLSNSFASREVQFSIKLSLFTTSISTFICMILAIPTSYILTRESNTLNKYMQIIIELPLCLPYLVLGLSLLILFSSNFGKSLKEMGLKVVYSQLGIIIAQISVNIPYAIRFIRTAFLEVDSRLEFIASTLGASKWIRFLTITIPLSKNAIIGAMILTWSRGLGEFGATLMLVGVTRMKTETLPASIYLNVATGDIGVSMASALILLLISSISLFIANYFTNKNSNRNRMKDVYTK